MNDEKLIVFVKAPRPGGVKTRLAKVIGADAACAAYQRLVDVLLVNFEDLPAVELRFSPDEAASEVQAWLRKAWGAAPQGAGDLGQRLLRAFAETFDRGAERVVIIGSDCPAVTAEDVRSAWQALRMRDVVLGPATDGGYWLIGLRQVQPQLFDNIPWSTGNVFRETLSRIRRSGLRVHILRQLSDVDTAEDWRAFEMAQNREGQEAPAIVGPSNRFEQELVAHGLTLRRGRLHTLQINLGRKCNQACRHCHVDAAPWRTEMIEEPAARRIGEWIGRYRPQMVDLTGGAPELSEFFRYFVETARAADAEVIDRNNLTIIEQQGYGWLPEYMACHRVQVIASLPCYSAKNVNQQRGNGVFEKSISALRKLNAVGYGTRLPLHLVYNPLGPQLPPPQAELEADYREVLGREFGIVFNNLFAITNQPIARFAEDLRKHGKWDEYLELLVNSFNPATVSGLMCRTTLSVGYRGELYDCDFNQMLDMQMRKPDGSGMHLWDIAPEGLEQHAIQTGIHCFACTAGCGSSCTGALTN